jgi:hypothetical protein
VTAPVAALEAGQLGTVGVPLNPALRLSGALHIFVPEFSEATTAVLQPEPM